MSVANPSKAMQSTLDPPAQGLRSRDVSKPQVGAQTSSIQSSSSPKPSLGTHTSQGLLSGGSASPNVTRLSPPVGQFIINTLLQIAGFAAAIAFGIYAIQSVTVGKDSNQSADIANQLALLGLCLQNSNQTNAADSICSRVVYHAASVLPDIASTLFPNLPSIVPTSSPTPTWTPTPQPHAGSGGSGHLTGIIVGTLGGLLAIGFIMFMWIRRRRSQKNGLESQTTTASQEKKHSSGDSMGIMQKFRKIFVETRVITETQQ